MIVELKILREIHGITSKKSEFLQSPQKIFASLVQYRKCVKRVLGGKMEDFGGLAHASPHSA